MDKQGRILIPGNLRDYAGLTREAMLIGVNDHVEIWDSETWERYNEGIDVNDIVTDLSGLQL